MSTYYIDWEKYRHRLEDHVFVTLVVKHEGKRFNLFYHLGPTNSYMFLFPNGRGSQAKHDEVLRQLGIKRTNRGCQTWYVDEFELVHMDARNITHTQLKMLRDLNIV